ncbi:MAG: hypothetical protein JXA25_12355 [Anaerolineales bacterium]|nr:hypothetical protein [Anaerolineales bacterium]
MTHLQQFDKKNFRIFVVVLSILLLACLFCSNSIPTTSPATNTERSPRLALWLAKKAELLSREEAAYDLVMTGWLTADEANSITSRSPQTKLLAGLTHTWILEDPDWLDLLITVANNGNPGGSLQITESMRLKLDQNGDGLLDENCSPPGWDRISAMDPRDPAWREVVLAFYQNTAAQPQHDGVIVDMVDAYPFCDGGWSEDVPSPISQAEWVAAQDELLGLIRALVPDDKWVIANAGADFPAGSPFPQHLNGYVLENFLGSWGAGLEEGLASAQRALVTTHEPHLVVFAVDTENTGIIDWRKIRIGLAASLLLDNTFFAFDSGPADHGGVTDWWLPVYDFSLGQALGPFEEQNGCYRRTFEYGLVLLTSDTDQTLQLGYEAVNIFNGESGTLFDIPLNDAVILIQTGE